MTTQTPQRKQIYEHPEIVSLLYFQLKNAYLMNNQENINLYHGAILRCLRPENRHVVESALTLKQIRDLKNLLHAIKFNIWYSDFSAPQCDLLDRYLKDVDSTLWYEEEKELEDVLCQQFHKFNTMMGTNIKVQERQFETDYGKIDILGQEGRTMHIIELKKDVANHKIIGQMLKYALHFQKRLIYNLYDDVKLTCVAGNYSDYCYNQLKSLGIATATYEVRDGKFSIRLV